VELARRAEVERETIVIHVFTRKLKISVTAASH
jgi:hypothetical protein